MLFASNVHIKVFHPLKNLEKTWNKSVTFFHPDIFRPDTVRHKFWRVGRAELCLWGGGGSKQLKIPPGGRLGRGCKISYIFFGRGGGVFLGNLETPLATPLSCSCIPPRNNQGQRDLSLVHHCINEMLCKTRA